MAIGARARDGGRNGGGVSRRERRFGGDVRQRHVVAGLHFDEPAYGTRELPAVRSVAVESVRAGRGRHHQLHAMIVQYVDEPREAARAVAHLRAHPRDAGQEQHRVATGELEIVALRPRSVAEHREVEPDGAARARLRAERASLDRQPADPRPARCASARTPRRAPRRRRGRAACGRPDPAPAPAAGSRCRRRPRPRRATASAARSSAGTARAAGRSGQSPSGG